MATNVEKVRLLISDVGGESGTDYIFDDTDIGTFLEMQPDVYYASALALRTMAANEAMVSKRIKFLELTTDGPAVAKALGDLADKLEKASDDDVPFEIAELGVTRDFQTSRYGW